MTAGVGRLSKQLFGDQEGSHATPSEISLTFYAYPNEVKTTTLSPTLAPTGMIRDADDYRDRLDPSIGRLDFFHRNFHRLTSPLVQACQLKTC